MNAVGPCQPTIFTAFRSSMHIFIHQQTHKKWEPLGVLLRKDSFNGLSGGHLRAVIQMGVDVAGGADVAVAQPFLNVLQGHAVGVEQAGAGMAQIVEADAAHTVVFEKLREPLRQMSWLDPLAQIVDVDIIPVIVAIALAAELPVLLLLCFYPQEQFLKGRHDRQTAE